MCVCARARARVVCEYVCMFVISFRGDITYVCVVHARARLCVFVCVCAYVRVLRMDAFK